MPEVFSHLQAPLGEKGSGRVRYGAAMALYRDGGISAEMLEIYRIASAHDDRDPLVMLREAGLPMPPTLSPVAALYDAVRSYLLALDHAGAAEVEAGLPPDPGRERPMPRQRNAVVDAWLSPALAEAEKTCPELAAAIKAAAGHLEWVTYDAYPRAEIGEAFADGHAFASIRGGDAPFAADDFDMGLFLIAPDLLYRDRAHPAPELYAPLTGPHGWRFALGEALQIKPAHEPIWNAPHQPHLTKVGAVPFLGLFAWTRDVDAPAVVLPADDWALLEEVSIV